ncbi:MAG TPA: SOS response-associated peptidase family protein, partial [Cyclobacteriaceae bacterium]|nr:SOS response-associated peptidase family protein [Cyclobacteriaceae bacterium]
MLLPNLSLSSGIGEIEEFLHTEFLYSYAPECRMMPGGKVPAITNEADNKIVPMKWGLEIFPGNSATPWLRSEGIISRAGARILIRMQRCLVLTNCFFIRKEQSVYLIYHPGEKILALAGVWKSALIQDRPKEASIAVLTRESPPALKKIALRVPVIISRSLLRKYLNIKCPLMDITGILGSNRYP